MKRRVIPIDPATLTDDVRQRFADKVRVDTDGCHHWCGAKNSDGYGVVTIDKVALRAPRVAWVMAHNADVPDGLQIDHLCRNRLCVNPEHLEAVTARENTNRQLNAFSKRTHCPSGHPYSGDNLYQFPDGRRACKTCVRAAKVAYNQRQKEAASWS